MITIIQPVISPVIKLHITLGKNSHPEYDYVIMETCSIQNLRKNWLNIESKLKYFKNKEAIWYKSGGLFTYSYKASLVFISLF
jgi:hypothetical protein